MIPDSYAYNEDYTSLAQSARLASGLNWTSDLAIECELQSESATGQVVFELVKGNLRYRCQIDLATGGASRASLAPKPRPRSSGIPIAAK